MIFPLLILLFLILHILEFTLPLLPFLGGLRLILSLPFLLFLSKERFIAPYKLFFLCFLAAILWDVQFLYLDYSLLDEEFKNSAFFGKSLILYSFVCFLSRFLSSFSSPNRWFISAFFLLWGVFSIDLSFSPYFSSPLFLFQSFFEACFSLLFLFLSSLLFRNKNFS